jgi:hypothetical protein
MTRPAHPTRRPTREERAFFDAIVTLRTWYAGRGTDDDIAVATVHHVIAAANAEMRRTVQAPRSPSFGIDAN